MGLLRRARGVEERSNTFSFQQYIAWRMAAMTDGGTVHQALRNAASNACISILARSVARTPFDAVRYQGKTRIPVDPAPPVLAKPSGIVRPSVWKRQLGYSIVTDGNAFGRIVSWTAQGWPTQIELLDPCTVTERKVDDGVPAVTVVNDARHALWPVGPIWHVAGLLTLAGSPFALSPLTFANKSIGTSLAVEDFSNQYFTDGAHPTHDITMDQDPGSDLEAQRIKQNFLNATRGNREPWVHGSGITLNKLQSDPGETGFIDLMRFEVEQACRFWLVPPSMVYAAVSGQNVTYSNVTQADLNYLKHSLDDYLVSLEEAKTDLLPRPQVVKANRDAILRADPLARAQIHEIRLRTKTRTVNQVMALEDEEPFEGDEYDQPGIPGDPLLVAPPSGSKLG